MIKVGRIFKRIGRMFGDNWPRPLENFCNTDRYFMPVLLRRQCHRIWRNLSPAKTSRFFIGRRPFSDLLLFTHAHIYLQKHSEFNPLETQDELLCLKVSKI